MVVWWAEDGVACWQSLFRVLEYKALHTHKPHSFQICCGLLHYTGMQHKAAHNVQNSGTMRYSVGTSSAGGGASATAACRRAKTARLRATVAAAISRSRACACRRRTESKIL